MSKTIKASDIIDLLSAKHRDDVFVPECKNGASYGVGMLRMDAWVMKKSWAKPLVTGYEVKVSRNDFIRDEKWHSYLDYCNEFYFVCPAGVIDKDELPPEAGLIYMSKNAARLYTKKKAVRRDVQIPEDVFRYILMCRATIGAEIQHHKDRQEYWREWLQRAKDGKDLGHLVSQRIRQIVNETAQENHRLQKQYDQYEDIRARLREMGFDTDKPVGSWAVRKKIDELCGELPSGFAWDLERTIAGLKNISEMLDKDTCNGKT